MSASSYYGNLQISVASRDSRWVSLYKPTLAERVKFSMHTLATDAPWIPHGVAILFENYITVITSVILSGRPTLWYLCGPWIGAWLRRRAEKFDQFTYCKKKSASETDIRIAVWSCLVTAENVRYFQGSSFVSGVIRNPLLSSSAFQFVERERRTHRRMRTDMRTKTE